MVKRLKARLHGKSKRSVFVFVCIGLVVLAGVVAAGGALTNHLLTEKPAQELSITPEKNTVKAGEEFTVSIKLHTKTPVDSVEAKISYNPSLVKYVSVDASNSGFPVELPTQTGNGSVTVSRGIFAPDTVSSDIEVAKVTFRALADADKSPLGLGGNAAYQGVYLNPSLASSWVTITK